ncbi:alpha/beta hydrolase family protein [Actinoplanes sp. NPDC048988]|uniref:alpha/beta hydrolase family protein n=1 Tax=Actinoplanes sp. NPDC048988 TaxID=3363901 RepID=UPI0037176321
MSIGELVVVLGSVALVVSRWLPSAARRPTAVAAVVVVLAGVAVGLPEIRWPVMSVLAADLLAAAVWLLRRRRWPAVSASVACLALIAAGGGAAWALPVPEFPEPSGPAAVGTSVMQWADPARDQRPVVVQLWYPAQSVSPGAPRAQYLGRTRREAKTVAAAEAAYLGAPAFVLDGPTRAHSHAVVDATPAAGRFPVVLFSPGLGGVRTQNTAWAEDLASRGYLVAGVDHPYDSAAVVLADGRTLRTRVTADGDRAAWVAARAADLRFVLTRLGGVGPADTTRAAATGHSIGGAAAMRAAEQDPRFTAVVNLDGGPDPDQGPLRQPVLALTHELKDRADTDYVALLSKILEGGSATSYRLTVPGSAHLTFTDAPLFLPPVPSLAGSLGRTASVRMTVETTAAFLDTTLRGSTADLPAALSRHGELHTMPAG